MDAKDLRTESAVSERNNDGSKYSQGGGIALHCDRNKSYQEIGSNSSGKVDVQNARPCAVIGPDRIVPPPAVSEAYHIKKGPAEPWPCMDNAYRRPPEYPHKLTNYQNPTRNISPRQTFQENMQRIMVPPTYNAIKVNDDTNYAQVPERSNGLSKNIKLNMPQEAKFCDVPYAVNPTNNEHKNVRNPEMCLPSANPTHTRTAPHGWPPGSVNLRSTRMYGAPEVYQYQDYPSCAGPRPVVPRPHRTAPEESGYVYAEPYYQEGNIRFKPYPTIKERYPQQRYEYIGNYTNPFHPPPGFPSHKYEVQKSVPPHPYPSYGPIKYLDSRVSEPAMEGYQRNPQSLGPNYNIQYRNQVIHPNYGVIGNTPQNKMHSYPPDAHMKSIPINKLPYDSNAKTYIEYENSRPKIYPPSESYFVNEMARMPMKSQVIMPNYSTLNMHNMPLNPYYKKDTQHIKSYEHMAHFRNMDPNINIHNPMSRHAPVFSPNTIAISPTDSNTSNDTAHTLGTSQEDCGYVSQSSTASVRSIDSGINRLPNEYIRKYYDNRYGSIVRTSPMMSKSQLNSNNNNASKDKKQIDVRQFLQMWNEGDEEQEENGSKEIVVQTGSSDKNNFGKSHPHEAMNSQEQLYVLGLVNVPSEELAKYEHIQKVSKLPENIKGYNSIELLNQFEEVIESSHMNNYKAPTPKESLYHMPIKGAHPKLAAGIQPPRPVSPLDVEAKISQSVIHKEVGCNFEIKPCSPKMLNVEVAAPVQNILAERSIEKVANPVMLKSPLNNMNENIDCNMMKRTDHHMNMSDNLRIPSCKMINTQFSSSNLMDPMKSSYSIQDLESNSGLCLASLPRLDNNIELNFPEVNQQFINANKGDNTVLQTSLRDLPTLEILDQSPKQLKDKFNNTTSRPDYDIVRSPYMAETEKEISKLSKYRKTKPFEPKETLMKHNVNAFRTDSVIIKNPENVKNHEENSDFANSLNKVIMDTQQAPINLTSQGNLSSNLERQSDHIDVHEAENKKQVPVEIAIDFSLNKTGILNCTDYMETKTESQIKTLTQTVENSLKTINKVDSSSDSVSLLPVFTNEENENIRNIDNNKAENCIVDCKKESQDVPKPIKEIKRNNKEVSIEEIPINNKSFQTIETDLGKCSSNNTEEVTVDVSCAQPASNTEIPMNELVSNICSEDSEKEFCDTENSTSNVLKEDTNCTLAEIETEISKKYTEISEEKYEMDEVDNTTNVVVDKDFGRNHSFVDKINTSNHADSNIGFDTSEIDQSSEVSHPIASDTSRPHENIVLASQETFSNIQSDLIQSQNINLIESVSSEDHIDCENSIKDEALTNNKEIEHTVNEVVNTVTSNTPFLTSPFSETNENDSSLESDSDTYESTDSTVESQLDSDIENDNIESNSISDQINDDVKDGTKIHETDNTESNSISDQINDDVKDGIKIHETDNTESNSISDQINDDVKDGTKIHETDNTESNSISDQINDDVKHGTKIHETDNIDSNSISDQINDDVKDDIKIQSLNTNSKSHPVPTDVVTKSNEIEIRTDRMHDEESNNKTEIQHLNTNLEPKFVTGHITDNDEDSTIVQPKKFYSKLHPFSTDSMENHITHEVEDKTEIQHQNTNCESHLVSMEIEDRTKVNNLHTYLESYPVSTNSTNHISDLIDDKISKMQFFKTNLESHAVSGNFMKDHMSNEIEDRTKIKSLKSNSESHPVSNKFEEDHMSDKIEERIKIQSLNTKTELQPTSKDFEENHLTNKVKNIMTSQPKMDSESPRIPQDFVEDHVSDNVENSIKQQPQNMDSESQRIPQDLVKDQVTDNVENSTNHQPQNMDLESQPITQDFVEAHVSDNVENSTMNQPQNMNSESQPIPQDLLESQKTDDIEDSSTIQPQNMDSESQPFSQDLVESQKTDDIKDSSTIQPQNMDLESQQIQQDLLENQTTDDIEGSTTIQSQSMNSEPHMITKSFVEDRIADVEDIPRNTNSEAYSISRDFKRSHTSDTEVDSTSQSSEELTDREKELIDFGETYCEDTQSSLENSDPCEVDQSVNGDPERQHEEPMLRNTRYGSKELYSPWIQKLLTFSEGKCNFVSAENYIDKSVLDDSAETINTISVYHDHDDVSVCDLEIKKAEVLEDAGNLYHKTVTENVNEEQDNSNDTVMETNDTNVSSSSFSDNSIDVNVNSKDHIECVDSVKDEVINSKESESELNEDDNIIAAGTPVITSESNEINAIEPSLESDSVENTDITSEIQYHSTIETLCEVPVGSIEEVYSESYQDEIQQCDEHEKDKQADLKSSDNFEHVRISFNDLQTNNVSYKKCQRLKRSLSDSALNMYNNDEGPKQDDEENLQFIWPFKRRKMNTVDNNLLAQKLCNIIHHNRRKSVSSFYNEENVSFCIVIDNSCIIAEEETEEPEKVCYTELSEECIAEIQNSCTNHDETIETLAEVAASPHQQTACDYSNSFMLDCEEDKTLEESWDEDVGCVETVISDDVAEDIEICTPSSPKDDVVIENDESGVFSSSEHTDKVKFIYGDKMCSDDALLVETLYNTPQKDVNKTLYNRETRVSEEYYDNDYLEKMLSESNERPVSPYVPQFMDAMFPSRKGHTKETPENKENMDIETFPSFQSKGNALDIVVDINVDKSERENTHSIEIFAKTRDTVHSCESSVDNVFTYNQRDEDAVYTSSSPEVSSTTSEEKNSAILLKITNYKGSRISQINDISRVNHRSSCKFTEEKEYLHSHNRPLLTKAAQKYIPPIKESIRDLKVKLSLPQHSLMKLKQLKISKDEPKVNKQNANIPRIPKKPKPKFEDVLKSIDEIQFKKHKEKTKKIKKAIPKVVIKKNINGSHYASTSNKDDFNPDLTGRKWQPWVFLEKNHFIDKMAIRKKTKAVYSHRKRTYVLAEKFQKYKSASSAKFVISPPISDSPSSGLKYTIRLKHNY